MKRHHSNLFAAGFVALVLFLASGSASAQELGDPPCCYLTPESAPAIAPESEAMILAQELGDPPCCYLTPESAPEITAEPEVLMLAQELGDPPCCYLAPDMDQKLPAAAVNL